MLFGLGATTAGDETPCRQLRDSPDVLYPPWSRRDNMGTSRYLPRKSLAAHATARGLLDNMIYKLESDPGEAASFSYEKIILAFRLRLLQVRVNWAQIHYRAPK